MAIEAARVAVTATAIALADGGSKNGVRVNLYNETGPAIYLGGSSASGTVTASTGHIVAGTSAFSAYVDAGEILYGIAASGTATVHVLKGGVESQQMATVAGTATMDGLGLITGSRAVAVVDETVTAVSTRRSVRPHLATATAGNVPAIADTGAS